MFTSLRRILEMIRFSHTLFALPFALLAAVMAWRMNAIDLAAVSTADGPTVWFFEWNDAVFWHDPQVRIGPYALSLEPLGRLAIRWQEVLGVLLCMAAARSAAMAFNRVADRRIDAANPRTAGRHLPAGLLSLPAVVLFAAACSAAFVLSTLLFLPNWLPVALAAPVLLFLAGYSYTKRFTSLAHFWLGAALMLAPVCAWIAIRGLVLLEDPLDLLPAVVLGGAVLLWVAGFDIIYACQDVDFDRRANLHSVPVRLGVPGALRLAAGCHFAMLLLLAALPAACPPLALGWIYWAGVAAVAGLLVYEHALVRPDDLTRVNQAFFHVNAVVSIGLFCVVTLDLLT